MKPTHCVMICLFLVLALSGCRKDSPDGSGDAYSPDGSRPIYFYEVYSLGDNQALYEVTVDQIFQHKYTTSISDTPQSIVLSCTVDQIFYQSPSIVNNGDMNLANIGDALLVWVDIGRWASSEDALRELFAAADSLVVHGTRMQQHVAVGTAKGNHWASEFASEELETYTGESGDVFYSVPPSIQAGAADAWSILPMVDGEFEAEGMISAMEQSDAEMAFAVDEEYDVGRLYFKNGDSVEHVYDALTRYVSEIKKWTTSGE